MLKRFCLIQPETDLHQIIVALPTILWKSMGKLYKNHIMVCPSTATHQLDTHQLEFLFEKS